MAREGFYQNEGNATPLPPFPFMVWKEQST